MGLAPPSDTTKMPTERLLSVLREPLGTVGCSWLTMPHQLCWFNRCRWLATTPQHWMRCCSATRSG